ncbi:MAG: hypothetical protein HOL07_00855 [Rhodospirillaceae bacterium]|jgi:hypothetical protein|nr:hypothetical protein [Rhodospirillaceae bacterium]MBT4771569.1 hypothetical protein [Rhodospirillaceae bacterium]MBT5356870.1 hypothetical protein [Rhodospirillaceae bacterium]MBT5770728.1 hypothetical protein [Rhodospirillaceae bacterium]MBT6311350.1 hypothetical protein [Rhodospirillaceae bacterium]
MMFLLLFGIVMAAVIALIANAKGRNPVGWFFYGVLIWPIALIHIAVVRTNPNKERRQQESEGRKPCPHCAEMVRPEARVCPHCRRELEDGWAIAVPEIKRTTQQLQTGETIATYWFNKKRFNSLEDAHAARDKYAAKNS